VGWIETKIEEKLGDLAGAVADEGLKTRTELSGALAQTIRGQRINGARPRAITPNAANATYGGRLVGWSLRAAGGNVALTFRDGRDATGDVIAATADLATGQAETHTVMSAGVSFTESLYVEATGTGTPVGALWFAAVD
jgi:hypothetical protein